MCGLSASLKNRPCFEFLDSDLVAVFKQRSASGQDVMTPLNMVLDAMNLTYRAQHSMLCLNNTFLVGSVDFRKKARCQVQNWLLVFFSSLLIGVWSCSALSCIATSSGPRHHPTRPTPLSC